jgi:hypothetical protein
VLTDEFYRALTSGLRTAADPVGFSIAVGGGQPEWDAGGSGETRSVTALVAELGRRTVAPEDIAYVDDAGRPSDEVGTRLRLSVTFAAADAVGTLRECGLFLGGTPEDEGPGRLLTYFTHPRIDKAEGMALSRTIRLDLTPRATSGGGRGRRFRWIELPEHWLAELPVETVDGIATAYASALAGEGVTTLGLLAHADPDDLARVLPVMTAVELHAKARLALRSARGVRLPAAMQDRTLRDVIVTPPEELAEEAGATDAAIQRLREQMFVLQVALSDRFLRATTVAELASGG